MTGESEPERVVLGVLLPVSLLVAASDTESLLLSVVLAFSENDSVADISWESVCVMEAVAVLDGDLEVVGELESSSVALLDTEREKVVAGLTDLEPVGVKLKVDWFDVVGLKVVVAVFLEMSEDRDEDSERAAERERLMDGEVPDKELLPEFNEVGVLEAEDEAVADAEKLLFDN